MTIVSAPTLLVGSALVGPGAVVMHDGVITKVLDHIPPAGPDHVQLDSGLLSPGLVDLQVNGCFGVDLAHATQLDWAVVRQSLARTGVTSFLPTFITAPLEDLVTLVAEARRERDDLDASGVARVIGAHLEGPFLSPSHAGAHDPALMLEPTRADIERLLQGGGGALVMLTLAPELPGGLESVRQLSEAGVVISVGHTDATAAQVRAAGDAGATMITHVFNAQRGLRHREPGVPGAAFDDPRFSLGLIADLHHVADPVVRLVFTAAAGRVVLVTDAVAAMGMPPGSYPLGGSEAIVASPGAPPRRTDSTLAGSTLTLDQAVRNVVGLGVGRCEALLASSTTPADVVGRKDLGRLGVGAAADLVWWDDALEVQAVWVGGVPVSAA